MLKKIFEKLVILIKKHKNQCRGKLEKCEKMRKDLSFYPQYVIRASRDGVVERVNHQVGETVAKGTVLVKLQEES